MTTLVVALVACTTLLADIPPAAAWPVAAPATAAGEHDPTALAAAVRAHRQQPLRTDGPVARPRSSPMIVQTYYDGCGDAPAGDLDRVVQLDDQATRVAWGWSTCVDGRFAGTGDELVLFLVDDDLTGERFTPRYLVGQFLDGYAMIVRVSPDDPDDLTLLAEGFTPVGPSADGRRDIGELSFDGAAIGFPLVYDFVVATFDADGELLDELPDADRPWLLRFPTECSVLLERRGELTVDDGALEAVQRRLAALDVEVASVAPHVGALRLDDVDDATLAQLAAIPGVRSAQRPVPRFPAGGRGGPGGPGGRGGPVSSWPAQQLGLAAAHGHVPEARVHVALVDQGVDATRDGLRGRVGPGHDAVTGRRLPTAGNTAFGDHGTALAGVIAADPGQGPLTGVNPGAVIRPVRLSDHDGCIFSDAVVDALDAVLALPEARVVNLSFGGPQRSAAESAAVARLVADGRVLVAAAGNDGRQHPDRPTYPAAEPGVIGVGASTADGSVADYSQQANAEVLAPGGDGYGDPARDVTVLGAFDTLEHWSGTSVSAAYVSGAVSLWLAGHPRAGVEEVRRALRSASVAVPGSPSAGRLDVEALLAELGARVFLDVPADNVHAPSIAELVERGITTGRTATTYEPAGTVTRAQMATFLSRTLGLPEASGLPFPDVDPGDVHAGAIAAIAAAGITQGRADGTYDPAGAVTRAEMASFLARAAGLSARSEPGFADVDPTSPHAPGIAAVREAGITAGTTPTTFAPHLPVRRDQMATFLVRLSAARSPAAAASPPRAAPGPAPRPLPDDG